MEQPDSLGRDMIYAAAPLKKGQWIICAQQEVSDAFLYLVQAQRAAIAIFVIGGLLIVAVSLSWPAGWCGALPRPTSKRKP